MFSKPPSQPIYSILNMPFITLFLCFYTLYIWQDFIIPIIISLLFSFAILWLSNFFQQFKINSFFSILLALSMYFFLFWIIWQILSNDFQTLLSKFPEYQDKIWNYISQVFTTLHIPIPELNNKKTLIDTIKNFDISGIFKSTLFAITGLFSQAWILFFYTLFILLENRYFSQKLILAISNEEKRKNLNRTLQKIKADTKAYFIIKSAVSFITATFSYIIMIIFNLDFSVFWAFLIFILNFIPNVGSIIALIFPIILSLIQGFDTLIPFFSISTGLIWIQVFMGNIIEPKFMGNRLNLSPLVIILSLSFWGMMWGIIGMILSVPIMIIINIILAKFPQTRPLAIVLSEQWDLRIETPIEVEKNRWQFIKKIREQLTQAKK